MSLLQPACIRLYEICEVCVIRIISPLILHPAPGSAEYALNLPPCVCFPLIFNVYYLCTTLALPYCIQPVEGVCFEHIQWDACCVEAVCTRYVGCTILCNREQAPIWITSVSTAASHTGDHDLTFFFFTQTLLDVRRTDSGVRARARRKHREDRLTCVRRA